jgi:hypothetical protein
MAAAAGGGDDDRKRRQRASEGRIRQSPEIPLKLRWVERGDGLGGGLKEESPGGLDRSMTTVVARRPEHLLFDLRHGTPH